MAFARRGMHVSNVLAASYPTYLTQLNTIKCGSSLYLSVIHVESQRPCHVPAAQDPRLGQIETHVRIRHPEF
jgi:hypothetical protein